MHHPIVYGLGTDLIEINRIDQANRRRAGRLAYRILGAAELVEYEKRLTYSSRRANDYLASRFASKEAFAKAIGLGIRAPMSWREVQILNSFNGAPYILVNGKLKQWVVNQRLEFKISISDARNFALATVIAFTK